MRRLFLALLASFAWIWGDGQIVRMIDDELYADRVKLVSQFMRRFNGEEFHPVVDSSAPEASRINLVQLFDLDAALRRPDTVIAEMDGLIDSILYNKVRIRFEDADWFATARCIGSFKGAEVSFKVFLTVEPRGDGMYKWVINDVEGDIFNLTPKDVSEKTMLLPNEHESGFMKLPDISRTRDDFITLYSSESAGVDRLTVFDTLVFYGFLDIDYVDDVEFTFLQVPGYVFTVSEHVRDSSNSGWLISRWETVSDEEKARLLADLYHGRYTATLTEYEATGKMDDETAGLQAVGLVEGFIAHLNEFISDPRARHLVEADTRGRYSFIIDEEIARQIGHDNGVSEKRSFRLGDFLDWLGTPERPVERVAVSQPRIFFSDYLKPEYASGFTLVKAFLSTKGDVDILEEVVFFIHKGQVAGIKLITDCF